MIQNVVQVPVFELDLFLRRKTEEKIAKERSPSPNRVKIAPVQVIFVWYDCLSNSAVDCQWTEWSVWSECSSECGPGKRTRSRTFTSEEFGGMPCTGDAVQEEICEEAGCPGSYLSPFKRKRSLINQRIACGSIGQTGAHAVRNAMAASGIARER